MIASPYVISPDLTIEQTIEVMKRHNISGLPVLENDQLVGIVTNRDIAFESDLSKSVAEIMSKDVVTTKIGTSYEEATKILHKHRIENFQLLLKMEKALPECSHLKI